MRTNYKLNGNMGWGEATARGMLEGLMILKVHGVRLNAKNVIVAIL